MQIDWGVPGVRIRSAKVVVDARDDGEMWMNKNKPDPNAAGQAGDLQGLSDTEEVDSESVVELLEEGQSFEAEVVRGVENAPDADVAEVTTTEVPEDDVPSEYLDNDR